MLNLSDKELDRLSREAAQEHDPGDILGSRSWEKLEPQLDKELGRSGPSPLRGVRRFPVYYVPAALLLVAGVFFFSRQSGRNTQTHIASGSPPTVQTTMPAGATTSPAAETKTNTSDQNTDYSANNSTPKNSAPAPESKSAVSATANTSGNTNASGTHAPLAANASGNANTPGNGTNGAATANGRTTTNSAAANTAFPTDLTSSNTAAGNTTTRIRNNSTHNRTGKGHHNRLTPAGSTRPDTRPEETNIAESTNSNDIDLKKSQTTNSKGSNDLTLSIIHTPRRSPKQTPVINDSALRAYKIASQPAKSKSLHINRSLQIGLQLSPDFSSVNSMAGDKPGSSIGITLDYQFADRWYLSTGLLLDRKNYGARAQDYKVPYDYYQSVGLHNVTFVKGAFHMLEIPVKIRYDFSVTGSTLFFASAGVSSYLLTNEKCNYYFDMFGREKSKPMSYHNQNNYLAASVDLSVGVETGLSNSLSLLIAPYVKLPSRNIGFGQVPVNSVGINFALKFAPVISRRRK